MSPEPQTPGQPAAAAQGDAAALPPSGASDQPEHAHRSHRVLVATLFTLAVVIGFVAMFSVWANRQALNTDNWTTTSTRLLADKQIQDALGVYLVNSVFSSVDVAGELKSALPARAAPAAGPLAAGLKEIANRAAPRLLATSQVQQVWRQANRAAHKQLLQILKGGSKTVSTANGEVTLNLHTLVTQLAATLGIGSQVAAVQSKLSGSTGAQVQQTAQQKLGVTIPSSSGQIVILRSKQLKTAQDIAQAIKGLALWATLLTFLLFAGGVWLAHGWRRLALRRCGWCFVGLGLAVLFARRLVGNYLVSHLVANTANRPAVHDVWNIGTSLLYGIAVAVLVYGIVIVGAAWVAGHTRTATSLRHFLAPDLRDRPGVVYGVAAGVFLLLLIWGPTPAFRQAIPILGMIALLILGIQVLRHQTALEFPDARSGDAARAIAASRAARSQSGGGPAAGGGQGKTAPANATAEELELLAGRKSPASAAPEDTDR